VENWLKVSDGNRDYGHARQPAAEQLSALTNAVGGREPSGKGSRGETARSRPPSLPLLTPCRHLPTLDLALDGLADEIGPVFFLAQ
jgi:hypothetical protein